MERGKKNIKFFASNRKGISPYWGFCLKTPSNERLERQRYSLQCYYYYHVANHQSKHIELRHTFDCIACMCTSVTLLSYTDCFKVSNVMNDNDMMVVFSSNNSNTKVPCRAFCWSCGKHAYGACDNKTKTL